MASSQRIGAGINNRPPALQSGKTARQAPSPAARSGFGFSGRVVARAARQNRATGRTKLI